MSILLTDWKHSSFDEKEVKLDHLIKVVGIKLRSCGIYSIDKMSEDLKLIKDILEKFDEEEKRIEVYCYVFQLRRSRLNRRTLEILCDLWDMVNSSKRLQYKDERWINENKVRNMDKEQLLDAIKMCKIDEDLYEYLLKSREIELPEKDFMEITSREIRKKIYEYQALDKMMERLECEKDLHEIPYAVSETRKYTFHGYKSIKPGIPL